MRALSIDLGGTHATCAVVEDRTIHTSQVVPTDGDRKLRELLPVLADTLRKLAADAGLGLGQIEGIAVGFCGLVDRKNARVTSTNLKYTDATEVDLKTWAAEEFGLPIAVENDARLALLGEWYAGSGTSSNDIVMMTLGTGIGGVAMIDGRLLVGKHFQAGCLGGHLAARFDGSPCNCGGIGCAESEASGWALPRICRGWPGFESSSLAGMELNFQNLFQTADDGDLVALAVREHCIRVWARTAASLIHAYDPELVLIGGGVMRRGDLIVPYIQQYVKEHTWTPWGTVQVRPAMLGDSAPLLGAVPLIELIKRSELDV
ncbi:ROK family protein [Edaphobacter modestus]|uniref:Glucokinase n=1 Tax=Edaphobacter modestus TaxID=388466 RepID=A0A4Q7YUL1_9BACT|nr:ROK family protein [Edaphobacter modestus]RZU40791.1 glucokinase [Edaphobacter modestus]